MTKQKTNNERKTMKNTTANPKRTQATRTAFLSRLTHFCKRLSVSTLLTRSGIRKLDGVPVMTILISLLSLVFSGKSMQTAYGDRSEGFGDDTLARFLGNPLHNWRHLLLSLTRCILHDCIQDLTSKTRIKCLIVDDSIYSRNRSKKVELLAWVYDHSIGRMMKGFRMLTLAWTDGYSTFGLDFALLGAATDKARIQGIVKPVDHRSSGYRRRMEAMQEAPVVLVDMIRRALRIGVRASYVLMDSWFCLPSIIASVKALGIDVIGMAKKSSKIQYDVQGQMWDAKQIYRSVRKKRGRAKVLSSVVCRLKKTELPVKLVFVRNRNVKRDWLVLVSTNPDLPDEEIVRIYGYRWEIEVFFKMCKQHLRLSKETQSRDYDALVAHTTIVFIRFNFLSLECRHETDPKSFGELFRCCAAEVADLTMYDALQRILSILVAKLQAFSVFSRELLDKIIDRFFECAEILYPQLFMQGCET